MSTELIETLRTAQRLGFFGGGPLEPMVEQAERYVREIPHEALTAIDLGSGGGLPGLVIASRLPDLQLTLVDRRQKRTDFLELAVRRLGLLNTKVLCADVVRIRSDTVAGVRRRVDVVTARGFGPPPLLLASFADLLAPTGLGIVSEPPTGDRWPAYDPGSFGLSYRRTDGLALFGFT